MYIIKPFTPDPARITVNLPEDEAVAWAAGATYQLNDRVIHDHKVYISTIASNTGIVPSGENQQSPATSRWLMIGATNAWAMFDGVLSNPSRGSPIITSIDNIGSVDTLILFGLFGHAATVQGYDTAGTLIQSWNKSLSGREVSNWWQYFKRPFSEYSDKMLVTSIPSTVTRLTITITGAPAALGEVVMGESVHIGRAGAEGTGGDGVSHSRIEFNDYGVATAIKRPTRVENTYRVEVRRGRMNTIKPWLDRSAGALVAAYASEGRPLTYAYGFLDPVAWDEGLPENYIYNIKIRGVI